jgi:hypothetical protein
LRPLLVFPLAHADPALVEFRFEHATATTVNLAGDFNGWCNPGSGDIDTTIDLRSITRRAVLLWESRV